MSFYDCVLDNCSTRYGYGGGVFCHSESGDDPNTSRFINCRFIRNAAHDYGGGLAVGEFAEISLVGCLFDQNTSDGPGGAFGAWSGHIAAVRCTAVGNETAPGHRGGAVVAWGQLAHIQMDNCILAFNVGAPDGGAVACVAEGVVDLTCSDVYGNDGGDWVGCIGTQAGQQGNMCVDPLFCGPQYNPELPHSLQPGSPCAPGGECGLVGALAVGCGFASAHGLSFGPANAQLSIGPSPCCDELTCRYEVPTGSQVSVVLYDSAGRVLQSLVDRVAHDTPQNEIRWNCCDKLGRSVPSGLYFLRVMGDGISTSRPVLIVR